MTKIVIANWKQHKTADEGNEFIRNLESKTSILNLEIIIAPPLSILNSLKSQKYKLCAQNIYPEEETTSGKFEDTDIKNVDYVLIGHSESRILFNQDDQQITEDLERLMDLDKKVILCIGETQEEYEANETEEVLKYQLTNHLEHINSPTNLIIAYEPIWAISTFRKDKNSFHPDIKELDNAYQLISSRLREKFGNTKIPILYGGSINTENVKEIFQRTKFDGGLVGKSSLDIDSFVKITESISNL